MRRVATHSPKSCVNSMLISLPIAVHATIVMPLKVTVAALIEGIATSFARTVEGESLARIGSVV